MSQAKSTFFPIGNADCCRIDLAGGEKLLFDYCHRYNPDDLDDKRIDLASVLREDLEAAGRDGYEVVAFTHLDLDHIEGASNFFHLDHDTKYQGEGRVKMEEMWVPAAVIIEEGCTLEAQIIQAEARHRLIKKKGIRVFSRPGMLEEWLEGQGMTLDEVCHLITDAGQLVPGWGKEGQGVEFFVHSPFASRLDDGGLVDRNKDSLFLQAVFSVDGSETRLILSADVHSDVIEELVRMTRDVKRRPERLGWDINNVPHHSSFNSLNRDDNDRVAADIPERVDWLYRQGGTGGYLISTSKPIPSNDDDDQPPHRQAADYYRERAKEVSGEYRVTMEYPSVSRPKEMVFEIDGSGARLVKEVLYGAAAVISRPAPRAG